MPSTSFYSDLSTIECFAPTRGKRIRRQLRDARLFGGLGWAIVAVGVVTFCVLLPNLFAGGNEYAWALGVATLAGMVFGILLIALGFKEMARAEKHVRGLDKSPRALQALEPNQRY